VVAAGLMLGWAGPIGAQHATHQAASGVVTPLFASDEPLVLTIEGPLAKVIKERGEDQESFPGTLRYVAPDGEIVSVPAELRTRGAFRLRASTCGFPPLRVRIDSAGAVGSLFEGQDKLKLVTHCQDKKDSYEQNTLLEYLLYRTYNLFTEASFRVRLAHITYVDTDGKRKPFTKLGFFIEPVEALAARNGHEVITVPVVPPDQMQLDALTLFEVFQYFIGNTDWEPFQPKKGEDTCCHNAVLIGSARDIVVVPVPYDFDWSGVVSAPYARPADVLGIRNVRERRFWGVCRPPEDWAALFPVFRERRDAIFDLYRLQPDLDVKRREKALAYLDEFYGLIGDEDEALRIFASECRG
jgi:hypothetical protein